MEETVVTVVGSQYTIRSVLDTLTSCCMQMAEILENEEYDAVQQSQRRPVQLPSPDSIAFWSEPEKSGWMQSQGEHIKTWRRRWFILKDGYLFRFSSPDVDSKTTPRGIVDLSQVTDVTDGHGSTGKENSIQLSTAKGNVYFIADSETSQVEWISALDEAIARIVRKVAGVDQESQQSFSHQLEKRYSQASRAARPHEDSVKLQQKKERAYRGDYDFQDTTVEVVNYGPTSHHRQREPEMIQIDYSSVAGGKSVAPSHQHAPHVVSYQAPPQGDLMDFVTAPPQSPVPNPNTWETHYTEDGRPYYYNRATGETTWEKR